MAKWPPLISVKVDVGRTIERLDLVRNLNPRPNTAYKAVREVLRKRILPRFSTKTDPEGRKWADWADSTKEERKKLGGVAYRPGPVSLLELTGAMKKSFFAETRSGLVRVGFRVPYARHHETGVRKSKKHPGMPARRVFTDGRGNLSRGDSIAVGLALREAVIKSMTKLLK